MAEDLIRLEGDSFFEVYNGITETKNSGDKSHPSTDRLWDIVLSMRLIQDKMPLYGIDVDDAHRYGGWVIHHHH